jgi:hypothetical protein
MVTSTPRTDRARFPLGVSSEYFKRKIDPRYFFYEEMFLQKPGIQGDITVTSETTNSFQNVNLEVTGQAATSTVTTFTSGGGCTLLSGTSDNDQVVMIPHALANQSALDDLLWKTDNEPYFHALIVTGATITTYDAWLGFSDNSGTGDNAIATVIAGSNDQMRFFFSTEGATSTTDWTVVSSRAGTDTETTTGVTVAASTLYRLEAFLDSDRIPNYYINGTKVATGDSTALTTAITDIKPNIAVATSSGAARGMTVRNFAVSQLYG